MILTCTDAVQDKSQVVIQDNVPGIINPVAEHTYQEIFNFWDHIFKDSTLTWVIRQSDIASDDTTHITDFGSDHIEKNTDSNLIAIAGSGDLNKTCCF
ncbi:DNA-dependent protein kinase catalytic subunit [Gigaspora margarita]|uniref:DNA-dependent protein kinase catalytic subunit n=1 Tax=Gigaspora margarita TaxID=4874 RepID=A0A8H3X4B5_GIGMA|nr:DNA-dependent protein kinase catalytic subunit [Gigaspora margarita]